MPSQQCARPLPSQSGQGISCSSTRSSVEAWPPARTKPTRPEYRQVSHSMRCPPTPPEPILARERTQESSKKRKPRKPAAAQLALDRRVVWGNRWELDLRPADALGGHQLADPLAGIEHAGLHSVSRHRDDLGDLLDRLLVIVDEVDDLAMRGRELRQAVLQNRRALALQHGRLRVVGGV